MDELEKVPEPIAKILEHYSGVPRDQQIQHILKVRGRALKAHPYPCLGRYRFLQLDISKHPQYEKYVLPTLTGAEQLSRRWKPVFLDIGTCLGQDLRKLAYDGVNPEWLWGSDINQDFIDAGHELFRDKEKISNFICPADVFDRREGNELSSLDGRVDIIHATAVFHLFNYEQQEKVADRCIQLLNPNDQSGTGKLRLIFGSQVGSIDAREYVRASGTQRFRHDEQSWRKMWEDVCDRWNRNKSNKMVKKVDVEAEMRQHLLHDRNTGEGIDSERKDFRWMVWSVWIEFA